MIILVFSDVLQNRIFTFIQLINDKFWSIRRMDSGYRPLSQQYPIRGYILLRNFASCAAISCDNTIISTFIHTNSKKSPIQNFQQIFWVKKPQNLRLGLEE